jgi:hypothetical protein
MGQLPVEKNEKIRRTPRPTAEFRIIAILLANTRTRKPTEDTLIEEAIEEAVELA